MITSLLAAGGTIDYGSIFTDLAIILIIAKIAAELFERIRVPAVLGEIIAGIVIGPSMLGLIDPSDAMRILAEVGVIILLAEVGLEMDLTELRKVGRASMFVAIIGVVVPMSSGVLAGSVLGESFNASLFLGAALAATSVGITARVFGDLKALSSTEARIVLGAAVADDVFGLIILTVVTRIVQQGSIDVAGVASTIGIAVGFIAVAGAIGILVVPRLFALIGERAVSPATIGVLAAGLTFGFSAAASGAQLAPIIGAFIAGTALSRTPQHDRISRDFKALGAIFIPVFFLQIGIDTDVTKFFAGHVLFVAAILTIIAIFGKVVAALGARGANADKLLIGIGMIPRGEVGLIFASIGVAVGVFDDELYAVVLLVVLLTTVMTPPLLRWRIEHAQDSATTIDAALITEEPTGGWLVINNDEIQLQGNPTPSLVLPLGLETSLLASHAQPNDVLLDWVHANRSVELTWDLATSQLLHEVLVRGNARSWRFLEVSNIIERALPEIDTAIRARRGDATELDPTHSMHMPTVEALRERVGRNSFADSAILFAAFILDFSDDSPSIGIIDRLVFPENVAQQIRALVAASALLHTAASSELMENNARNMAQLADFLGSPLMVEQCRMLTEARGNLEDWQYPKLLDITTRVQELLAHPELIGGIEGSVESVRRSKAMSLASDPQVLDRLRNAAPAYILAHEPETLTRQATLVEPAPSSGKVRVSVESAQQNGQWTINIATHDMRGLLARICAVLTECRLEIVSADLATWPDKAVLDSFVVNSAQEPNAVHIANELENLLKRRLDAPRLSKPQSRLTISLDNDAHPWHSVIRVTGADQPGLLQTVATAFAKAKTNVHHAHISTQGDDISDRFEVSTRHGRKLGPQALQRITNLLS